MSFNKKHQNKNITKISKKKTISETNSKINIKYFLLFAILIFTFFIFSKTLNNEFVNWDDDVYVTGNNYITDLSFDGIKKIFLSYTKDELPITHLSLAIDYHFWKLSPKPYHVVNLIFHLFNIILVFYFINLISKKINVSLITALLFAIHPFRVESVAWTAERKDVLFTFFYLLSIICYYLYLSKNYKIKYLLFSLVLSILSLLSKFTAVTLPAILLLIDYYYSRKFSIKTLLEKIPFLIFPIISVLIHFYISNESYIVNSLIINKFSFFDRIFFAGYALSVYLFKFIFPFNFSAIHPFPAKASALPIEYYIFTLVIIFLAFIIIRYLYKKPNKNLIFGILFFLITISLVLHIVPFGGWVIFAERYTYLPYIGLFFLIGHLFAYIIENKALSKYKSYVFIIFGLLITYYSIATFNRCKVWNNSISLFTDVIEKYPEVALAYDNRAEAKARIQDYKGAMEDCNYAIKYEPDFSNAYCNRGNAKGMLKDYEGAIIDFTSALKLAPKDAVVYFNRGITKHFIQDFSGALSDYDMAIKLKPNYFEAYFNRGNTKTAIKDYKGAIEDYNKAIYIKPDFVDIYKNRASARFNILDYNGAINDLNFVLTQSPNDAYTFFNRAVSKIYLKKIAEACNDLSISSQLGYKQADELIQQYCKQ